MKRSVRTTIATLTMSLVLAVGCDRGQHPGNIDKPAPLFVMSDGVQTVDMGKLRGKTVVLNLWATWCAPCVEELPSLLALQQKMPNITVVAVSTDQDDTVYRNFLVKHNVNVLTVRDADQKVNQMYGTVMIPETYIIDRNGLIRRKFIGAQSWDSPDIVDYLNKL